MASCYKMAYPRDWVLSKRHAVRQQPRHGKGHVGHLASRLSRNQRVDNTGIKATQ